MDDNKILDNINDNCKKAAQHDIKAVMHFTNAIYGCERANAILSSNAEEDEVEQRRR